MIPNTQIICKMHRNERLRHMESPCLLSLEGTLLASLAVCTAASADVASGVARRTSHISCWHSLYNQNIWGNQ